MHLKKTFMIIALLCMPLQSPCYSETIYQDNAEHNTTAFWQGADATSGTVTTSTDYATSGVYSYKVNLTGAGGTPYVMQYGNAVQGATLCVRFRLYLTSGLVATLDVNDEYCPQFELMDASYVTLARVEIYQSGGTDYLILFYHGGAYLITAIPSADAWHTIEVKLVRAAGTSGSIYLYVDGVLADSDTGVDTGDTNVRVFLLGCAVSSGVTGAYYIDDLVIDNSNYIGPGWRIQEGAAVGSYYYY